MMIPKELIAKDQWVLWKTVIRDSNPIKMPFQPSGQNAKPNDPCTWNRFSDCLPLEDRYSGLGFMFSGSDGFVGVDLDGCRHPDGTFEPWALEILDHIDTYTEISPSRTGVKMFGYASQLWDGVNNIKIDVPSIVDKKPGIEVYDKGRYFAVTGLSILNRKEIKNIDTGLAWLKTRWSMARTVAPITVGPSVTQSTPLKERAIKYVEKMEPSISGQAGHNAAFKAACVLVKGFGLAIDEAREVFVVAFNNRCQPPWNEREIEHKLNQAAKQPGSTGYLADALPEQWSKITLPSNYKEQKQELPKQEQKQETKSKVRVTLKDAAREYLKSLESNVELLHKTGIPQLDDALFGGVADGEMVIIAARPSHGKSAIALQISHNFNLEKKATGIISEEMSSLQLGKRAIMFATERFESDWRNQIEKVRYDVATHFVGRADSYIVEACGSVAKACEEIEAMKRDHDIKAAFVDYAQILTGPGKDRYNQVTNVSMSLRQLASRLKIPVFVLAQLSREIEKRDSFIPSMRDLKETGQLEQDADVIIFAVWPHRLNPSEKKERYQLYLSKNRNRGIKKVALDLHFNAMRQMVVEQDPDSHEDFKRWG